MPRSADRGIATRASAGFTLLELVIVIVLVVVLFLVAFDRLMPLRGQAEAAHVEQTIGTINAALGLAVAERVIADGIHSLAEFDGSNPVDQLAFEPERYAGRVEAAAESVQPGHWYFVPGSGELGYRVRFPGYLDGPVEPPVHLRWRVTTLYRGSTPNAVRLLPRPGNPGWDIDPGVGRDALPREGEREPNP